MNHGVRKEYLKGTRRGRNGCRFPVESFLRSRLGQNWDKVHSELSQEFDRRTYAGYMFWKYMGDTRWFSEITIKCWIGAETGRVYNSAGLPVNGFYVHPFDNTLCYQGVIRPTFVVEKPITRIVIDSECAYEKINGIWFHTKYEKNDDRYSTYYYDIDLRAYGYYKPYTIVTKQALSKKKLKKLGLKNSSYDDILQILKDKKKTEEELKKKIEALEAKC